MNSVFDQDGAAGIMFKDLYITALTGYLFATPYSLSTHGERKPTPIYSIKLHYKIQCEGRQHECTVKKKMLTEATRFRSVLSSQAHRQTCVTYLEMFKLSHILQLENVH